jgi:3-oxoacyl-[acyl-carrier protein] reductase
MDLGLAGRRAAVAGASAGLGFAVARALAEEGVAVALCGRDRARIEAAAAEIGRGAVPLVADVSTRAGAEAFVTEARAALGGIDILVANGGGPPPGTFASTDVDAYLPALEANLIAAVAMCKLAVPEMQERGWGRVLAITSVAVRQPIPNLILSNSARTGLTGFLKTMASEVAGDGVTVNSLQPGLHRTERVHVVFGDDLSAEEQRIPARTIGDPDAFGRVAAFLCSEHAAYLTGTAIPVDGGSSFGLL